MVLINRATQTKLNKKLTDVIRQVEEAIELCNSIMEKARNEGDQPIKVEHVQRLAKVSRILEFQIVQGVTFDQLQDTEPLIIPLGMPAEFRSDLPLPCVMEQQPPKKKKKGSRKRTTPMPPATTSTNENIEDDIIQEAMKQAGLYA